MEKKKEHGLQHGLIFQRDEPALAQETVMCKCGRKWGIGTTAEGFQMSWRAAVKHMAQDYRRQEEKRMRRARELAARQALSAAKSKK